MLNKDITFIYWDTAERNLYQPIAEEALKRGYKVSFSNDKTKKCEIGIYCQHVNFPCYSKFSVIMLHDIIQQYSCWPNLWYKEPWDKYDIGVLPSKIWEDNWNKCSQWKYARPRQGIYKVGWPKADVISTLKNSTSKKEFFSKYGLDLNKRTILYAPAWENDRKQDDFVKSMQKLDVNILIKQADWPKDYPQIIKNIEEMAKLHKDLPNVTIMPPATNIFEAIAISDVLVSEESSTMCEAAMMGIPSVSVSDWLIPDTTPSRYPKCDYDFVIMTKKSMLTDCIRDIINNYNKYHEQSQKFCEETFSNIGKTSSIIMDIIDDCIEGKKVRHSALKPKEDEIIPLKTRLERRKYLLRTYLFTYLLNGSEHNKLIRLLWPFGRKIKRILKK